MAVLSDKYQGVFNIDVDVSEFFEGSEGDFVITLREPTMKEYAEIEKGTTGSKEQDGMVRMNNMTALLEKLIINHTFEQQPSKPYSTPAVAKMLDERPVCMQKVLEVFGEFPLTKKMSKSSDK